MRELKALIEDVLLAATIVAFLGIWFLGAVTAVALVCHVADYLGL